MSSPPCWPAGSRSWGCERLRRNHRRCRLRGGGPRRLFPDAGAWREAFRREGCMSGSPKSFEDPNAARRITQMGRRSLQMATSSESSRAVPTPLPLPAPAENRTVDCTTQTPPYPQQSAKRPIHIGPYMWLRSETGGVLFGRTSAGGYERVRLARYSRTPGFRFRVSRQHFACLRYRLICRIATALQRLRAPADPCTTPLPEMRPVRTDQGPSTRPSVSNRFRFSVRDDADATDKGGAA